MHALRSPKNLTRQLLTNRSDKLLDQFEERFQTRLDKRERRPQSNLGLAPRVPLQAMAQAVARLEAVAGEVNSQMRAALERLLKSEGEHLSPDDIEDAVKRVSRVAVTSTVEAKRLALATANTVDKFNRRDVRRTIGIDVPEYSAPLGERWRREHIALIRSIPEEAKARFTTVLRDASKKQTRVETITKALREQEGITHRRARLIARDQVLGLNAKLNADRHKRAGIEEYEWLSLRDGSVRGNHAHLHGKRFRYDDPPMGGGTTEDERGNPGDGIGCRCQAVPVIPEFEAKPVEDVFRSGKLSLKGRDIFVLSKTTPDTLRPESLDYLRKGGAARAKAPISFEVYPDTGLRLTDGRHRITVAREQRVGTLPAEIREYDRAGKLKRKKSIRLTL